MDELQLLIDLHRDSPRQGPGGDDETRLALTLAGLRGSSGLRVADIGCGTGAALRHASSQCEGALIGVDLVPRMLEFAAERAAGAATDACSTLLVTR